MPTSRVEGRKETMERIIPNAWPPCLPSSSYGVRSTEAKEKPGRTAAAHATHPTRAFGTSLPQSKQAAAQLLQGVDRIQGFRPCVRVVGVHRRRLETKGGPKGLRASRGDNQDDDLHESCVRSLWSVLLDSVLRSRCSIPPPRELVSFGAMDDAASSVFRLPLSYTE